ncbi:MAG: hypothetical protein A2538_01345 [Candidatus Magasanikbacteria bacterium RIFOXYD2_FULL_41_14]|uniref:M23ase beta-sheet core domain-containing protein n=1 Tax=Candidatus Magasanikbacteria bacterium RIFOXYD2_FULL_41_14 TaxID=1798709 RepID=A0A1F6PGN6_9BACT|nr:MAG: hypothetical protein A2538_01345 [Candidatus Magasanikbacteria bacterium RIFOXYD2_FULL_41_14]
MKKLFKIISAFIITGVLALTPFLVFAQETGGNQAEIDALNAEIAKRKDTITQLESTIATYDKSIKQKQLEGNSLKNQIAITDDAIAQIEAEAQLTEENIKQTDLSIQALEISIGDKETTISRQQSIISQIIQSLLINDRKNFLEIMLTNDNFADFYNQAKYLESIYTDLGRSVKTVRLAKEDLQDKKVQASAKKKTYEDLKVELVNKQTDLSEKASYKSGLLTQTKADERRYQAMVDSLRKQYQLVENEVRTYEDKIRQKLSAQNKLETNDADYAFSWPVPSHYITSYFHDKSYPFKQIFEHSAIDLRASQGTPVMAAASGYVGRSRTCTASTCYSYVLIVHTSDLSTVYGHLSKIIVAEDQFVNRGDIIGYSGATPGTVGAGPFVTGPHLHFEVRLNGIPVDPLGYLIQ